MTRPWMKFYPSDWRADPALRMCSIGARGFWMEMLCVMHEASPYGSLLINGVSVTRKQMAGLAGVSEKDAVGYLVELSVAGVFSTEENGTIYSRRMRRDEDKAERDKANGKGGGNPMLKGGVNPPVNGADKAQTLDTRHQNPEIKIGAFAKVGLKNGSGGEKGWTPPKHGATGKGRVYVQTGTPEWDAYAEDYRDATHRDPEPNKHGGKWFKTLGEAS